MTSERFSCLVVEAEKSLYRVAKSILFEDEDCADAIQNALLKAFDNLGSLKKEEYFKTWLTRILINECYLILRSRTSVVSYEEYMENEPAKTENNEVFAAVASLDEIYRVPFVLHYVEGYSVAEISKMLKLSESNIKVRLFRARERLKDLLEEKNE